jgi:peptide/nickel transport system ATP-binding protein
VTLVELADKHTLFGNPQHPYTQMLLDAIPKMHDIRRAERPALRDFKGIKIACHAVV